MRWPPGKTDWGGCCVPVSIAAWTGKSAADHAPFEVLEYGAQEHDFYKLLSTSSLPLRQIIPPFGTKLATGLPINDRGLAWVIGPRRPFGSYMVLSGDHWDNKLHTVAFDGKLIACAGDQRVLWVYDSRFAGWEVVSLFLIPNGAELPKPPRVG